MAKAEKASPPKPSHKLTKKEQAERFKRTARELGCDESPGAMDRAFGQIDPKKPQKVS
jgi:hypothetical protein